MKRPFALVIALVVVALVGTGCGSSGPSTLNDAATMSYNLKGKTRTLHVTRARLLSEVRTLVDNKPFAKFLNSQTPSFNVKHDLSSDSRLAAIWLTELIQQATIDELFATRHVRVTPDIQKHAVTDAPKRFPDASIFTAFDAKFRATMTDRTARQEALLASFTDTSDTAGEAYFKAHAAQFGCPSGKNVSHILVKTPEEAQAIEAQLAAGTPFATLAKQKSTDTQSGAKGGLVGCLTPKTYLAEFQKAADAATVGTPTAPVHTSFGYHIILVTTAPATKYADVRAQIVQALQQQGSQDLTNAVNGLYKKYKVHVDPRFGTWGPTTDSQGQSTFQVTEPTAPKPAASREGTTTTTIPAAPQGSP